ncbi:hypothetical protein CNMCM8927_006567 [Aspergillus lentulus]|uniref:Uncharacterized protein n=1 Tax=Aspergillus lentulus TaxID=293939 RepID=A0AAN6BQC8_ASPLE|nr:hypothetical protein CNMCM8927_006567 [Aspergillus lentulus]
MDLYVIGAGGIGLPSALLLAEPEYRGSSTLVSGKSASFPDVASTCTGPPVNATFRVKYQPMTPILYLLPWPNKSLESDLFDVSAEIKSADDARSLTEARFIVDLE